MLQDALQAYVMRFITMYKGVYLYPKRYIYTPQRYNYTQIGIMLMAYGLGAHQGTKFTKQYVKEPPIFVCMR